METEDATVVQFENPAILYVDDEPNALKYFRRYFARRFRIYTAQEVKEADEILEERHGEIGIVVTDQRMPGRQGIEFLEEVRVHYPDIVRVLTTASPEVDVALAAINQGETYRLIPKPWDVDELATMLVEGQTKYVVRKKEKALVQNQRHLVDQVGRIDHSDHLSSLALWAGLNVRNALVPVKKFIHSIPRRLEEENLEINRLKNSDFWGDALTNISRQVDLTNTLLSDLFAMSQKAAYFFVDKVSLHGLIESTIEHLSEDLQRHGLEVVNQVDPDLPELVLDHPKIARLLELVLKRRMLEVQSSGTLTFQSQQSFGGQWRTGDIIQIFIKDHPLEEETPEIDSESSGRGYEREAQNAESGLYLLISHMILYYHGGKMERIFHDGRNETIILSIPLDPKELTLPG